MEGVVGKIWLLFGWFYLSLIPLTILYFYSSKIFKKFLSFVVVLAGAFYAVSSGGPQISADLSGMKLFFRPVEEKIESTTHGQASYAAHLREILPNDSRGCILWSWDLPTLYLQKELYPLNFAVALAEDSLGQCEYVISQFNPRDLSSFELVDSYKGNFLYKREIEL